MKNIKTFDTFNIINEGLFSEEGDFYIKKIINILKTENIKIQQKHISVNIIPDTIYSFMIDDIKYETIYGPNKGSELKIYSKEPPITLKISTRYLIKIENMYKKQVKQEKIQSLPDISELGRDTKRFNL